MVKKLLSSPIIQNIKNGSSFFCQVIRDTLNVFLSCWLCFAMLGFGFYALHINDQGRDVITSLDPKDIWMLILIHATLVFWAYEVWFSARFTLLMSDFSSSKSEKRIEFLEKTVLIITSVAPIGLFLWACYRFNKSLSDTFSYIIILLVYVIALYYRDRYISFVNKHAPSAILMKKKKIIHGDKGQNVQMWQKFLQGKGYLKSDVTGVYDENTITATQQFQQAFHLPAKNELDSETVSMAQKLGYQSESPKLKSRGMEFKELSAIERITFWFPLLFLFGISFFVWISPVKFPQTLTPLVIIFLSMGVWTGMITYLIRLEKQYHVPAFFLAVLINIVFSFFNNNHAVRISDPGANKNNRCDVSDHFCQWLNANQSQDSSKKIKKVILVAGQGGGIRAAYWTASILAQLQDTIPDFEKHIYAISAVSGSSLGAAAYNASLYDSYNDPTKNNKKILPHIQSFLSKDYLSPVTAAFVFPDMLQRFWFYPIESFDRAKFLEYSWEEGWNECSDCNSPTFKNGFSNLWSGKTQYAVPSLFLNGTHAETGRKVITTNLSCADVSLQSHDIIQIIGKDIPLSTAALLSARFPGVTPGALIPDTGGVAWGNVVDGGYYDNSGVVTLLDMYKKIMNGCNTTNWREYKNDSVQFVALVIQNGTSLEQYTPPLRFMYEAQVIPSAFMNAYNVRPEQEIQELASLMNWNGDTLIEVNLPRVKGENLPLGWFLSTQAQTILNTHIKEFERGKQMKWLMEYIKK